MSRSPHLPLTHITTADLLGWLQRREQRQQQEQQQHQQRLQQRQHLEHRQHHHQQHQPQPIHPSLQPHSFQSDLQPRTLPPMVQYTSSYPPLSPPHQSHPHYQTQAPAQTSLPQHPPPPSLPPLSQHPAYHDAPPPPFDQQHPHLPDPHHLNGSAHAAQHLQQPQQTQQIQPQRQNRLRKACDSCSIRKVKCDETGPPCKGCKALDIPCTFERPSRRRGPPNRHAEAIKRQRLEAENVAKSASTTPSSSTFQSPAAASAATKPSQGAEAICPLELVSALIDDYFTFVHPLAPFPHEPWFRENFRQRRDLYDGPFLALLGAMIGALTASYPRRPRMQLRAHHCEDLFSTSMELIKRCHQVIFDARGVGYLDRQDIGAYDAATSYLLFLMCAYTYRFQQADLYLGECFTILRALSLHQRSPEQDETRTADFVEREMARRIYWVVFTTVRSAKAVIANEAVAYLNLHPPTATRPHPDLPVEVDDLYITPTRIGPQPKGHRSVMTGFNMIIQVYLTYDRLISAELSYAVDGVFDPDKQKRALAAALDDAKSVFVSLPEPFSLWQGAPSRSPSSSDVHSALRYDFSTEYDPSLHGEAADQNVRRTIGFEIQKANLHISLLSTRSFFVERYWSLCKGRTDDIKKTPKSPGENPHPHTGPEHYRPGIPSYLQRNPNPTDSEIRAEREAIANDVLGVLACIRPIHMEPNSVSFCMKIRQIASTLLPSSQPRSGVASISGLADGAKLEQNGSAAYYLNAFLEVLTELDKGMSGGMAGASTGGGYGDAAEEEELRRWVDLRQHQRDFKSTKASSSRGRG